MELDKTLVKKAQEMIGQAKRIVILTHMAPDGDAMGSALALYHYLTAEGGLTGAAGLTSNSAAVSVIVPNAFPAFFNWMPGASEILVYEKESQRGNQLLAEADLFLCTDFNEPKRIGAVGEKMLQNPAPKILWDHHLKEQRNNVQGTKVWDTEFSFPEACSSCEIVYNYLKSTEYRIQSTDLASCLYTGLMTDTGNFSFNSTSCELYEIIADLIRAGAKKDEIYNAVFNQYSTDRVRLTGYALYRKMRIYPEAHLALITLSADELDQFHYQVGDTEGLVNMPLQIADVYYSVYMREERPKPGTPKPRIRISFRSQGDRPVNVWANEVFHGGGHMNASGGELFGSLNQAVQLFEKTYKNYLKSE
jgi:phosphoesterase RecJ-like protein